MRSLTMCVSNFAAGIGLWPGVDGWLTRSKLVELLFEVSASLILVRRIVIVGVYEETT